MVTDNSNLNSKLEHDDHHSASSPATSTTPTPSPIFIAAVEGGGTSFRVAVGLIGTNSGIPTIVSRTVIDSSHDRPDLTLEACANFLSELRPPGGYHALGIASFGPVGLDERDATTYGRILPGSPKAVWRNVDLITPLRAACVDDESEPNERQNLIVSIDTDVNAPALAEFIQTTKQQQQQQQTQSLNRPITSLAYITVGTGVGVGLVVHGEAVHGRMHPEMGHIPVQPLPGDIFAGYSWGREKSPFYGVNTVEGLASSVALTERLQQMQQQQQQQQLSDAILSRSVLADLPDDHEIWVHATNALANLCVTLLLTLSMEKIVLGGGIVTSRPSLLPKIQQRTIDLINGYIELPDLDHMSSLIDSSQFGPDAGLIGAMVLAQRALEEEDKEQDRQDKDREKKREAFLQGLWHGALVGGLLVALIYKYGFRGASATRRR